MRVADLGCLEGGYTLEFAKLGFDTVGIEARDNNLEKCFYLKEQFKLPNLNFLKDDVRNISAHGKFDIVLNYGLLYHLNDPVNFLKITAENNSSQLLFLNTHFAPEEDFRYSIGPINQYFLAPLQKRTKLFEKTKNYRLSAITTNEDYRGRWLREWSAGLATGKIEKKNLSAFNK